MYRPDKDGLKVTVGDPVIIDQYQGPETDGNEQAHHFCGLIRAGNGNLIALYSLRRDRRWPEDIPLKEFLKKNVGYRVSTDNGRTWSGQRELDYGGVDGGTLADGTVLAPTSWSKSSWWVDEHEMRVMINRSGDGGETWALEENVRVRFPKDRTLRRYPPPCPGDPDPASIGFWVGPILPVEGGRALVTMSGLFAETAPHRWDDQCSSILVETRDGGRSWDFVSCIAGDKPTGHRGYFGTALTVLKNGDLLAVAQTEDAQPRIMVQCWSRDGGRTWTTPILVPGLPGVEPAERHYTTPDGQAANFNGAYQHPVLAQLDNGVLALAYGRPGITVAFNLDGTGRFWEEITEIVPRAATYSYAATDVTAGKPGMVPVGPDRLLLVYDIRLYAEQPTDPRLNTVFVREVTVERG